MGIALLGSIGTAVYRGHIQVPADIAGSAAGQAAHETLAGAVAVAADLPTVTGRALLSSAREAFTYGLNTTATVCAVALLALAMVAVATLKRVPPMAEHAESAATATAPSPASAGT